MRICQHRRLAFLACLLLSTFPVEAVGTEGKPAPEGAPVSVGQALKTRNPAFLISVESVLQKLKQNQEVLLVDIRKQEDFERIRIPGSINLPLFAIKTKTFLRPKQLVLVEEGFHYRALEQECKGLRGKRFNICILNGGLNSWAHKRGPLVGDVFAAKGFSNLRPRDFFEERDFDHWVFVDISKARHSAPEPLSRRSLRAPFEDEEHFSEHLKGILAGLKNRVDLFFLFFNKEGESYEASERIFEKSGLIHYFFLEGGSKAYARFIQDTMKQQAPGEERTRTFRKCSQCGDKG